MAAATTTATTTATATATTSAAATSAAQEASNKTKEMGKERGQRRWQGVRLTRNSKGSKVKGTRTEIKGHPLLFRVCEGVFLRVPG